MQSVSLYLPRVGGRARQAAENFLAPTSGAKRGVKNEEPRRSAEALPTQNLNVSRLGIVCFPAPGTDLQKLIAGG